LNYINIVIVNTLNDNFTYIIVVFVVFVVIVAVEADVGVFVLASDQ